MEKTQNSNGISGWLKDFLDKKKMEMNTPEFKARIEEMDKEYADKIMSRVFSPDPEIDSFVPTNEDIANAPTDKDRKMMEDLQAEKSAPPVSRDDDDAR